MPSQASFVPIAGLMFLTGIGIPIMATLNAGLGQQLGSPVAATFVLFVVGVTLAALVLAISGDAPSLARISFGKPWLYAGAVFILFYALSITWAAPRIGVGNAVFFVLLGQLVAAATIDHFGLWGAVQSAITPRRVLGIAVMALGVYLARKPG
ncbi:MAG TPA: DMT family transporter [Novosphingobium sp.]